MSPHATPHTPSAPAQRAAAVALVAGTILSIIFVALDPQVGGATHREIMQGLLAVRPMHILVHVVAAASLVGYAFGFTSLAQRLDLRRPPVLVGLVAYLAGCGAILAAVVGDGLITGDIAAKFLRLPDADLEFGYNLLRLVYVGIQDFTIAGLLLQATGSLFLAGALLRERGHGRVVGGIGLLCGGAPIALIVANFPGIDQGPLVEILLAQAVWNAAVASWLFRRAGRVAVPMAAVAA